jgi:hypothetical protein
VQDEFSKNNVIINARTKKKYSKSQIHSLIVHDDNYRHLLEKIADTYAVDPVLLEDILIIRGYEFKKFKKLIEGKYRFIKVRQDRGITIVEGELNNQDRAVVMRPELMNACTPLFQYIDSSDKRYIMNGKKVGLYEVLKTFADSEPKNIERAKGLGSLNAQEIGISTLDPKNRKLLRYTSQDIDKEIEEMRKINDDKFNLIKAVDISQYEF